MNSEAKQVQQAPSVFSGSAAKTLSNECQAVIARIGANQAEASCTVRKNCAIVLGLAGDGESGFTRIKVHATCTVASPWNFRAACKVKQASGVARWGANQAKASCTICKSCVIVESLAVTEKLGFSLAFR